MTGVLVGAVVLSIVLTLMNIALLLAVVRRLRVHETKLGELSRPPEPTVIAAAGHEVGELDAQLPALVGFFSPGCDACHAQLPDFRKVAAEHAGGVLAVVVEDGAEVASLLADLGDVGQVVAEQPGGPLTRAFAVSGFPAFAIVDTDGRVRSSGFVAGALT